MSGNLFMKVLDMSKTGAIVIAVVIIARLLLRRAPKIISYALWAVVLLRLLCPVSFESRASIVPKMTPVSENYALADESISIIGASEAAYKTVSNVLSGSTRPQSIRTTVKDASGSNIYVKTDPADVFILFGQYVWLAGVAVMLIWSVIAYIKLRHKLRVALPYDKNIFIADDIKSPFVMGIAKPKIYLPCGLGEKEREYIILHEEHHIKRLDHIIKILAFAALALHWFNPFVWLAFILAGRDMEMSCDEAVIRVLGSEVRADYSSSLLALATGRRIIAGSPLSFGEGDPKGRIKNLSKWKKPAVWAVLAAGTVGIILAVCLLANPKTDNAQNEDGFYLVIGEDNVSSIEISEKYSSGSIVTADGSQFKEGEKIWLDLDADIDLKLLRGLTIKALDADGNVVYTLTVPEDALESEIAEIVSNDAWLKGPVEVVQAAYYGDIALAYGNYEVQFTNIVRKGEVLSMDMTTTIGDAAAIVFDPYVALDEEFTQILTRHSYKADGGVAHLEFNINGEADALYIMAPAFLIDSVIEPVTVQLPSPENFTGPITVQQNGEDWFNIVSVEKNLGGEVVVKLLGCDGAKLVPRYPYLTVNSHEYSGGVDFALTPLNDFGLQNMVFQVAPVDADKLDGMELSIENVYRIISPDAPTKTDKK